MEQTTTNTTNQAKVYQSRFVKLADDSWDKKDCTFKAIIPVEFTNAVHRKFLEDGEQVRLYIARALDRSFPDLFKECREQLEGVDDMENEPTTHAIAELYMYNDALLLAQEYCAEAIRRYTAVDRALYPDKMIDHSRAFFRI